MLGGPLLTDTCHMPQINVKAFVNELSSLTISIQSLQKRRPASTLTPLYPKAHHLMSYLLHHLHHSGPLRQAT